MARKVSGQRTHEPTKSPRAGWQQNRESAGIGPRLGFAGAILAGVAAWSLSKATLPPDAVMPVVSTLLLVLAAAFAMIAWQRRAADPNDVTYTDVAGALTLIGLCAAATIDPDQMVRLVHSGRAED